MLALRCLGLYGSSRGGTSLRTGWKAKGRELVAHLVAHPEGPPKERIIEELWPGIEPRQGGARFDRSPPGCVRRRGERRQASRGLCPPGLRGGAVPRSCQALLADRSSVGSIRRGPNLLCWGGSCRPARRPTEPQGLGRGLLLIGRHRHDLRRGQPDRAQPRSPASTRRRFIALTHFQWQRGDQLSREASLPSGASVLERRGLREARYPGCPREALPRVAR